MNRNHNRALGVAAACCAAVAATGCATGTDAAAPTGGCPEQVNRLIDPSAKAGADLRNIVDLSPSGRAPDLARHGHVIANAAVRREAALTVTIAGRSPSDATTVLACPALVPLVNDEAARESVAARLVRAVATAVTAALRTAASDSDVAGSDVLGALVAESLRPAVGPLSFVVETDGLQAGAPSAPLRLPGAKVGVYGVGAVAGGRQLTGQQHKALRDHWTGLLLDAGATPDVRFTGFEGDAP